MLCTSPWPTGEGLALDEGAEAEMDTVQDLLGCVRRVRALEPARSAGGPDRHRAAVPPPGTDGLQSETPADSAGRETGESREEAWKGYRHAVTIVQRRFACGDEGGRRQRHGDAVVTAGGQ